MGERLSNWQFYSVLIGSPATFDDGQKFRYPVADAMRLRAKARRAEGRPDIARRLSWAAAEIETGNGISKKLQDKLKKDISIIREQLLSPDEIKGD